MRRHLHHLPPSLAAKEIAVGKCLLDAAAAIYEPSRRLRKKWVFCVSETLPAFMAVSVLVRLHAKYTGESHPGWESVGGWGGGRPFSHFASSFQEDRSCLKKCHAKEPRPQLDVTAASGS